MFHSQLYEFELYYGTKSLFNGRDFFFFSVQTLKGKKYPSLKIQFLKYYFGPYDSG